MTQRYVKRSAIITRPGKEGEPPRAGRYPFSATTLWRKVRDGKFPPPIELAGVQCWPLDVLERWEAEQMAGSRETA